MKALRWKNSEQALEAERWLMRLTLCEAETDEAGGFLCHGKEYALHYPSVEVT